MDDFLRAVLTMLAIIAIVLIVGTFLPGWFNSVNSHELVIENASGVFH